MIFCSFFRKKPISPINFEQLLFSLRSLSQSKARRVFERFIHKETRSIHCELAAFYRPYSKNPRQASLPETHDLLPATGWLIKKYPLISAEFRALNETLPKISFEEIDPVALASLGVTLDQYVEQYAFRFTEESLAETINEWQKSCGHILSLVETEAISSLLRTLALNKLACISVETTRYEQARVEAQQFFHRFGSNWNRFLAVRKTLEKNHPQEYAAVFSATFSDLAEQAGHPIPPTNTSELSLTENFPNTDTSIDPRKNVNDRVRVLLRSLPLLGEFHWNQLLRKTNSLHKLLTQDPSGTYARMTSLSQEHYRRNAASLAHQCRVSEEIIARIALELARKATRSPRNHVGYYIIGDGFPLLVDRLRAIAKVSPWRLWRIMHHRAIIQKTYLISLLTYPLIIILALAVPHTQYPLLTLLAFPFVFKIFKHILDSLFVSTITTPTPLPRLNFSRGIPRSAASILVIPAFLKDARTTHHLLGKLETAYLSNTNDALDFCLLLDYTDASTEHTDNDEPLLQELRSEIEKLNRRYGQHDRFTFFLRSRVWSDKQGRWMGWERKRGKLVDFAKMLRGKTPSSPFIFSSSTLPKVEFILTLDEDTYIPRDFAKNIVGTHAHPLHRPVLDTHNYLLHGYTFIQPQVRQWFKNRHRLPLARIFFDERRFSAYADTAPEIYQDIFQEGSFNGKGCFHIDSYLAALDGALPLDQILSHDLLEGSLSRTAYASGVQVFDEFPSTFQSFLARNHRWTRGDWQIIDWLFPTVRDEYGVKHRNTLAFIHRFKIIDNLVQSLARPSVFIVTFAALWVHDTSLIGFIWFLFFVELFLFDTVIDWIRWLSAITLTHWQAWLCQFHSTLLRSGRIFRQAILEAIFLPYTSLDTLHAIATATWRRYISGKNMLEWTASAHFQSSARRTLLLPCILTITVSLTLIFLHHENIFFLSPLLLWMVVPLSLHFLNRPFKTNPIFSLKDDTQLRTTAFKTWLFFSDTVRPDTHFLPPDYVRYAPRPSTATYTSITNIGFYLASLPGAHTFGYLSLPTTLNRLADTLNTLERLERFRGHFYNWYDIVSTRPAPPLFISSVDSGNLAACLITVRQWLDQLITQPSTSAAPDYLTGLIDIADVAHHDLTANPSFLLFSKTWASITDTLSRASRSAEDTSEILKVVYGILSSIQMPNHVPTSVTFFKDRLEEIVHEKQSAFTVFPKEKICQLFNRIDRLINEMRFDFLKSKRRSLISVGYHVPSKRLETRLYQTLASEARITNLIALSQGAMSFQGWNRLNRKIADGWKTGPTLLSWTGTLFEYLMPGIFVEEYSDSAAGKSIQTAIAVNRRFAKRRKLTCWGLSESGYYEFDKSGNYRYKPLGVSELALSPLVDDRPVVSAYAIALTLPYTPKAAFKNLNSYAQAGGIEPNYGFIESVDFSKNPHGSPVRMCMSHHQGMIFTTLANLLFDKMISRLFESYPSIQSSLYVIDELLPPPSKEPFPQPHDSYLRSTLIHPRTP